MKKHLLLPILTNLLFAFVFNDPLSGQCNAVPCTVPTPYVNAQDACILPNPAALDCYFGATMFTPPESFPPSWCTTVENNHFFAFTADAPTASFEICTYGCISGEGIQAAVLSTTDCINFEFVSPCLGNIVSGSCAQLLATGLTPGVVYFLMIDGNAGAVCDYSINGASPTIIGQTGGLCLPNASATYTTNTISSWSINPPTAGSIQGNPVGTSVNIKWSETGPAQVCAQSLSCLNAPEFCLHILIGVNLQRNDTVSLCENFTVECAGQVYSSPGNYTVTLPSYLGCDSTVNCIVNLIPTNTTVAIQAPQGQTITCLNPTLLLLSQNDPTVSHLWKNVGGDTLGTGNSIFVSTPGFYFHEVKSSTAGINCSAQAKILIKQNTYPPPVTAMGGTLDAAHPTVQLMGNSIISGVTYLWTGPNGFTSTLKKPIVSVPGFYTLTVTNPPTGCTNSITVEVIVMN